MRFLALVACLVPTTAWSVDASCDTFAASVLDTPDFPSSVALADLDEDGVPDVVMAGSGEVLWRSSATGVTAALPYGRLGVVHPADLDDDGDLDLVVAEGYDSDLGWMENLGAGAFAAARTLARVPEGTSHLRAADLDGDGDLDLALSGPHTRLAWLENVGSTTFGAVETLEWIDDEDLDATGALLVADLDGDGDLDLGAVGLYDGFARWHENLGGSFGPPVALAQLPGLSRALVPADLDGDGDDDLIYGSGEYSPPFGATRPLVGWLEHLGGGAFAPLRTVRGPAAVGSVLAADVDGDGDLDIVSAGTAEVAWSENLGGGAFAGARLVASVGVGPLAAADLDGDGAIDLVATDTFADTVWVLENLDTSCGPTADVAPCLGASGTDADGDGFCDDVDTCAGFADDHDDDRDGVPDACDVCPDGATATDSDGDGVCDTSDRCPGYDDLADADADGFPDACDDCAGFADPAQGALFSDPQLIDITGGLPEHLVAADLDGDGDLDLVTAGGTELSWYENAGDGPVAPRRILGDQDVVAVVDVDDDGRLDVVTADALGIVWLRNLGDHRFAESSPLLPARSVLDVWTDDLDGDGDDDLLALAASDVEVRILENRGGSWVPAAPVPVRSPVAEALTADLDGDGDPDLLTTTGNGTLDWLEDLGGLAFGPQQELSTTAGAGGQTVVGDLDGDGDLDVLRGIVDFELSWLENAGGGSFGPEQGIDTIGAEGVMALDFDGDGDDDVFARTNQALLLYGAGGGSFAAPVVLHADTFSYSTFGRLGAADLDGDGDPDLISSRELQPLSWLENGLPGWTDSDGDGICDADEVEPPDTGTPTEPPTEPPDTDEPGGPTEGPEERDEAAASGGCGCDHAPEASGSWWSMLRRRAL